MTTTTTLSSGGASELCVPEALHAPAVCCGAGFGIWPAGRGLQLTEVRRHRPVPAAEGTPTADERVGARRITIQPVRALRAELRHLRRRGEVVAPALVAAPRLAMVGIRHPRTSGGRMTPASAHSFLYERADPCPFGGGQPRQREGRRPQHSFVEVRRVTEAEGRVPRLELLRALEEADDLTVLGVRGHP